MSVSYGNVSVGEKTARLGITVDRSQMLIIQADRHLCGKRLECSVVAAPPGEERNHDQGRLAGMEPDPVELAGVADVKSIGVHPKTLSFGLTFQLESIDVSTLAQFAKRIGRLQVTASGEIPEEEEEEDDTDEGDDE